jgi:hypothetical protein
VYVGGRKLRITQIRFRGGTKDDPTANASIYKYCQRCSFATDNTFAQACPTCQEPLITGTAVDYDTNLTPSLQQCPCLSAPQSVNTARAVLVSCKNNVRLVW